MERYLNVDGINFCVKEKRNHDGRWVTTVTVPPGILMYEDIKNKLSDRIGVPLNDIVFLDEKPRLSLKLHEPNVDSDVDSAKLYVNAFLRKHKINPKFLVPPIEVVKNRTDWLRLARSVDSRASQDIDERILAIEGYTTPKSKNQNGVKIYINGSCCTVGSIVHEIFHGLSDPLVSSVWECGLALEEGLTEYLTCLSLSVNIREDAFHRGSFYYRKNVEAVRKGIESNAFDVNDLFGAYFFGDKGCMEKICNDFCVRFRY